MTECNTEVREYMATKKAPVKKRDPMELILSRLNDLYARYMVKQSADAEYKLEQSDAIEVLDRFQQDTVTWSDDYTQITATVVRGVVLDVDEEKLKAAVGSKTWAKLQTPKLDMRKLEAAVALGEITPDTLAECSEEKPRAAYIRWTAKQQ